MNPTTLIRHPNCKINLGLKVMRRRDDGYHELEGVFVPVPLCDELSLRPAPRFAFGQDGIPLDSKAEDNLVVRAYRLMERLYPDRIAPMEIRLTKHIPFGAGLGGGSSDAAFALGMINELCSIGLTTQALQELASRLGADCPFFVENQAALVTGIGDKLQPLPDFTLKGLRLVLVKPAVAVPTADAYRHITPRDKRAPVDDGILPAALGEPHGQWPRLFVNDFEKPVFALHPELADIKERLYRSGAFYASMSGSGSALYALYEPDTEPCLDPNMKAITIFNTIL